MSLVILTKTKKSFFTLHHLKQVIKKLIGRQRGPQAVLASLLRGLDELGVAYLLNPPESRIAPTDVVWVHEDLAAIRWAIKAKQAKKIAKLFIGPAIAAPFAEIFKINESPEIDGIFSPSVWGRDFAISIKPKLEPRIFVWPAGVEIPQGTSEIRTKILIFIKNLPQDFDYKKFEALLPNEELEYLYYGKYKPAEYFQKLNQSKAMIYFSNSESQGLALQEAWARNLPTLVWDRGFWQFGQYNWRAEKISCPYLTASCGMTFQSLADFPGKYVDFKSRLTIFNPRKYVMDELTDKRSAEKFLEIVRIC